MFLGAMIVGPLAAVILKQFDRLTKEHIRSGFEMLVENFSLGILGGAMAILALLAIGPIVRDFTSGMGNGVQYLVTSHLLPVASVIVEPAKVLFLNNAINHGVLAPLGVAEAAQHGKSILFMVESDPGPGLGILLAYLLSGPKALRPSVPGAIIIQFFGGIHEIYFPYVLMTSTVAEHWCGGSSTRNIPWLNELVPEPMLEIPESLAQKLSLKTGDWVKVSSARGELTVKAVVTPRMKTLQVDGREVTVVWMKLTDNE